MKSIITEIAKKGFFLLFIGFGGLLSSCNSNSNESIEIPESPVPENATISISPLQFNSAKMELGTMTDHGFHQNIKTNGIIDVPPQNRASVSVYFGGFVKTLSLLPGTQVRKGEVLFTLENPEYLEVQRDYLEAVARIDYLKSDYERQKLLAEENVSSQKNALKAQSDYQVTAAELETLKEKLKLMNIDFKNLSTTNLKSEISVRSPLNGYVTQMSISIGAYLNPQDVALSIVDTEHMHVELGIFEKDIPSLEEGQLVKFKVQGNDNKTMDAKIHLINRYINPETRIASIHCHLIDENDRVDLFPGMHVEAEIFTNTRSGSSLPFDAVVDDDGYYVLVLRSADENSYEFEQKEVKIGKLSEDQMEILNPNDFKPEDQFLVKGAFNLIGE